MKEYRQNEIMSLISDKDIETQEELLECLRSKGFKVTQATISRDIRELGLVKVAGSAGRYKYAMPRRVEKTISTKFRTLLTETVQKVDRAGNIAVVKTYSGMAQGAAAAIDSMERDDVVGCVAGDDTIIIVMRTPEAAQSLTDDLYEMINSK